MYLPKDPIMLLSVINTQLRDRYDDLDELCEANDVEKAAITEALAAIDYKYDAILNQFK